PLDPAYPRERLALLLEDSAAPVVLVEPHLREVLPPHGAATVVLDGEADVPAPEGAADPGVRPENLAYVIYTSGSTGRPKGVMIAHAGAANMAAASLESFGVRPGTRVLQAASLSFDASVLEIFMALGGGGTLVVAPRETLRSPDALAALLREREVEVWAATPSLLDTLPASGFPRLRAVSVGGERCGAETAERWARGRLLLNLYAPTEATVYATREECGGAPGEAPPLGRPIAGAELYVLDGRMEPVPPGVAGEIHLGGAGLARGYLGRPEETAARFVPHPFGAPGARLYRSGDRGRYRPDGRVEFLGRTDQQVKVRGHRVELGEIEAALAGHPEVGACAAAAREDAPGEVRLVAYVVPAGGSAPSTPELRALLSRTLPDYMVPGVFVTLGALPLTPSGKVDRRALPAPGGRRPELEAGFTAPRTETERLLAEVWQWVLRVERVGVEDDFFQLGGDSILAIRVVSRAREAGVEISPRQLFEHPTVGALARAARRATSDAPKGSRGPGEESAAGFPLAGLTRAEVERLLPAGGEAEDAYPLSPLQEGLLFHSLYGSGPQAYVVQVVYALRGELDAAALREAWRRVVALHPALRTVFVWEGVPEPLQVVRRGVEVPWAEEDWRGLSPAEQEAKLGGWMGADRARGFALSAGPLVRFGLLRTADREHRLVWTMHHLLADGWSAPRISGEAFGSYRALRRGEARESAAPRPYRDYIAWVRERELGAAEAFWRGHLRGFAAPTPPGIGRAPSPAPGDAEETHGHAHLHLSAATTQALQGFARRHGLTLNTLVQGAWALLLSRYSGEEDVLFGAVVSGRPAELEGVEEMVGLFINTLPVRVRVPGGDAAGAWLKRLQEEQTEARQHEYAPLAKVQGWSEVPQGTPLFESLLIFESYPDESARPAGEALEVRRFRSYERSSYPLTLVVVPLAELRLKLDYARPRFDEAAAGRMLAHLEVVLREIAADAGRDLSAVPIVTEAERRALLARREPEAPGYASLPEQLAARARETPGAPAIFSGGRVLTRGELDARANRLARHLRGRGIGRGDRVGVCLERSVDVPVAVLGILRAGGVYVPLDPEYPETRLAFMAADAELRALVTTSALRGRCGAGIAEVVALDADGAAIGRESAGAPEPAAGPEEVAYLIYTSGSTGTPR
ncbi:MAG TPA: amino acid adenylation domain-containing protein, partial [Longimicrobiaceae bacterium]|nr:amino acid adenylation domain-containing protein [Longimicrobiaceae bacterium]